MWEIFRTSKLNRGKKEVKGSQRSLNVNEEYHHALRTKSYADFFTKAQSLMNDQQKSSDILLEPRQETITTVLESALLLSEKSDLKALLFDYFDISAEASKFCSHLLKSINQVQSHYRFMQQMLEKLDDYSSEQLGLIVVELGSFIDLNKQDFKSIHEKYSSVLQLLKSKRKRVVKKIKFIKVFNKASGICVTAVCGLVAVTALAIAAHTLTALVLGPALFSLPIKPFFKKKLTNLQFLRSGFLRKVREQLDVAAKGTYILNRDFDTMSRLVSRLHDEIEHNRSMIQFCLDRREDRLSLQVVKELRKSDVGFRKQVEELEEHLYLCLVTINRARVLVIKEVTKSEIENNSSG